MVRSVIGVMVLDTLDGVEFTFSVSGHPEELNAGSLWKLIAVNIFTYTILGRGCQFLRKRFQELIPQKWCKKKNKRSL